MKIIDKQDRKKLSEGRNTGIGFAFLKRNKDEYTTVQPISPCKDYLNEVVYTENTGIPSRAYGLDYPTQNKIFNRHCYLVIKVMGPAHGGSYLYGPSIEEDTKRLKENCKNIELLLHYFEDRFKIEGRTVIKEAHDDYFVVKAPLEWRLSTMSISMYTLLLRLALVYDGSISPMDYLEKYSYNKMDADLLRGAMPKIKYLLEKGKLPEQPESHMNKGFCPHNYGIMSLQIKKDEKAIS